MIENIRYEKIVNVKMKVNSKYFQIYLKEMIENIRYEKIVNVKMKVNSKYYKK
jgi:hypothetical protein